jgi:hypothetical protein
MLRIFVEQRVRSRERMLRFAAYAKHPGGGDTVERSDRDLQRVALRPIGCLLEQRPRAFDEPDALFGAEVGKSGVGGLGVVAHVGHCVAASLEMRRQLGGGDRNACGALSLQRGAHFPVELCPRRW